MKVKQQQLALFLPLSLSPSLPLIGLHHLPLFIPTPPRYSPFPLYPSISVGRFISYTPQPSLRLARFSARSSSLSPPSLIFNFILLFSPLFYSPRLVQKRRKKHTGTQTRCRNQVPQVITSRAHTHTHAYKHTHAHASCIASIGHREMRTDV